MDVGVWPTEVKLDPRGWLDNFSADERPYALQLLDSFIYFSTPMVDALLEGGIANLAASITDPGDSRQRVMARWADYLDSVLVTFPTKEQPGPTDSGQLFARKARQVLGFDRARILSPPQVLEAILTKGPRPVLFVDDLVGTGTQFMRTWRRPYNVGGVWVSFATLPSLANMQVIYAPLIATHLGSLRLAMDAPEVSLLPAHLLDERYGALHPNSYVWPASLRAGAEAVIRDVSARAGIPDTNGTTAQDWRGFGMLALGLAFEHSTPDATLPLFYWEQNDWQPLIRRA